MIAYLTGTILDKQDHHLILMTHGVGYLVRVTNDTLSQAAKGQELSLWIHTHVREDALDLFGFASKEVLTFFQQLLQVSGIGPKTALSILQIPIESTKRAIHEEDLLALSAIPGLGKKTAGRLVLELKGKVFPSALPQSSASPLPRSLQEEALEALMSLGYDKPLIIRFLNTVNTPFDRAEDLVRAFLQSAS